ncbi:MAG: (Fe-S)-binding protein [Pygmaiobacter massiliensis]|nr:(Fe-S)-binding protein [Pygmaiobacter massiliensis]
MNRAAIPSISIAEIDRDKCYFNPGCAMSLEYPQTEHKALALIHACFGPAVMHNICCHHNPGLPQGSVIINTCGGCDRRFRSLYPGIRTISLWELLDSIEGLPLPRYPGLTVSVHDSCPFRQKPQVHAAVRNLLHKMEIQVIESEFAGTESICCGDDFYGKVPLPEVTLHQKKRAAQMPAQQVVVYCVSCIKSMAIGGKTPRHILDLVLGQSTDPKGLDITDYHDELQRYIDQH